MIKNFISHPVHLRRLFKIKNDVYKKVGELSVRAYLSDEPAYGTVGDEEFVPFRKGQRWANERFGCCIFKFDGKIPYGSAGKKIVAVLKFCGEGEIYKDKKAVHGLSQILSPIDAVGAKTGKQIYVISECAEGGERIEFETDCGHNGYCGTFLYNPRLLKADIAEENEIIKDYYYDYLFLLLTISTVKNNDFLNNDGVKEIERKLNRSFVSYLKGDVYGARAWLNDLIKEKQTEGTEYTAIGHGHLDLAWKWPIRESKRKALRTFTNVLNYEKKYDFVFGASQAQMFEWVKESDPEVFAEIKKAVECGEIEIQGGMWTECDCNMPCGESLIRQFLYGNKFFMREFGKDSDVVWLPDAFGFPHSFPQIIKGVGKKYFLTTKLSWNLYNKFPYQTFNWIAPDGSEVIAHMPPEGSYHGTASPINFVKADKKNIQKDVGSAIVIYGVDDGGGGPGEAHLEMLKRSGNKYLPKTNIATSQSFFEKIKKDGLPDYNGELYLERHQGTLTSQAKTKYLNALAERKMHLLEWLEAITFDKYEKRDELWKKILTNQFHDILPGSSISRVHNESETDYTQVCEEADVAISKRIEKLKTSDSGLSVLNYSPFPVGEKIVYNGETYFAECKAYSSAVLKPTEICGLAAGDNFIENSYIKATFGKNGEIISFIDKTDGKEYSGGVFHTLKIYCDPRTKYDAWDIDRRYLTRKSEELTLFDKRFEIDCGRAKACFHYKYNKSDFNVIVYVEDSKELNFDIQCEWNENHKMLRADCRPSVWSDEADFDIQFGSVKRSTKDITDTEKAMFEVCGQKYACVNENGRYVYCVTESKYGYRVKNGLMSLNLLRSPTNPDKNCDKGLHSVKYAYGIASSEYEVVRRGYLFNNPPLIVKGEYSTPEIFDLKNDNIITETVKPSENGNGVVVRLYERFGRETVSDIPSEWKNVRETDMLERNAVNAEKLSFKGHEIKTYIIDIATDGIN